MLHDSLDEKITVDEFLAIDFGTDCKSELVDGAIYLKTGGAPAKSPVTSNILAYTGTKLRGAGYCA